jgi:hypothetical protein
MVMVLYQIVIIFNKVVYTPNITVSKPSKKVDQKNNKKGSHLDSIIL